MDGAGGVGGLLFVENATDSWTSGSTTIPGVRYAVQNDGNGNVMGLVTLDGPKERTLAGRFDYDAFGNRVTNTLAEGQSACPIRFSSKYEDVETGLLYYGFRYYDAVNGRWTSRDPIGEQGGINLYGMVGNDPVNRWDYLGLADDAPYDKEIGKDGVVTMTVHECSVVILDGHGHNPAKGKPHKFKFPENQQCPSAGMYFGCYPGDTNGNIRPENHVPGAPMDNERHATWEKQERQGLLAQAKARAEKMCKCCKQVKVVITSTMPQPAFWEILTPSPADDKTYTKKCPDGRWSSTKANGDFSNLYPD